MTSSEYFSEFCFAKFSRTADARHGTWLICLSHLLTYLAPFFLSWNRIDLRLARLCCAVAYFGFWLSVVLLSWFILRFAYRITFTIACRFFPKENDLRRAQASVDNISTFLWSVSTVDHNMSSNISFSYCFGSTSSATITPVGAQRR